MSKFITEMFKGEGKVSSKIVMGVIAITNAIVLSYITPDKSAVIDSFLMAGEILLGVSVAKEVASRNINVNAIAPGFIETKMTEVLSDGVKEAMLKQIPLSRFGKPEDVGNLVLFLVSDDASYITGQVIKIDGGMLM